MKIVWSPLAIERVAEFPESGTVVPELTRTDVREVLHGEYRIIYRRDGKHVLVLTVRHGRRLLDPTEVVQDE